MENTLMMEVSVGDKKLQIIRGDITKEKVDAIVNAANSYLAHGGGVAAAIVRAGGTEIQEESNRLVRDKGPVPTGKAVITGAGRLPAKHVIHAVGPIWRGGNEDEDKLLSEAVISSLELADDKGLSSIALPAISLGIFGFPKERGARIILGTILEKMRGLKNLKLVRVVLYSDDMAKLFVETLKGLSRVEKEA